MCLAHFGDKDTELNVQRTFCDMAHCNVPDTFEFCTECVDH